MQTQLSDVIIPDQFTAYTVENSLLSTALYQSGVVVKNGAITDQLAAGAEQFTIPFWADLADDEADITSDDPTVLSTPKKISANKQTVRKSFLHQSWSEMSLASELAGSSALERVQSRVTAYWDRQMEKRVIATCKGILSSNATNNGGDMVRDISGASGAAAQFSASAVIDTAATMGDRLENLKAIAMHSTIYVEALKNDLIQFLPGSQGSLSIPTFRGLAVIVDDNLTTATAGVFVTILFGPGAIGYGITEPNTGFGTELERKPAAGNGGGQSTLHSRLNVVVHPLGFAWNDGTGANAVAGDSPSQADISNPAHWTRAVTQRKSVPLAFLVSK